MILATPRLVSRRSLRTRYLNWSQYDQRLPWPPPQTRSLAGSATPSKTLPNHPDPAWFTELQTSMLARPAIRIVERTPHKPIEAFEELIRPFIARPLRRKPSVNAPIIPVGFHPLLCNNAVSGDELLPDGTDKLHWPGPPFDRRVWVGGSVWVDCTRYYSKEAGLTYGRAIQCRERIVDVRLRGQGKDAGIVVTVERRFAQMEKVEEEGGEGTPKHGQGQQISSGKVASATSEDRFKNPLMIETRDILFLGPIVSSSGPPKPTKYLPLPKTTPTFTSKVTGLSPTFLHSFSQLTKNAHKIHLDASWARNMEGYQTALVHGSMTALLLLQCLNAALQKKLKMIKKTEEAAKAEGKGKNKRKEVIERITYRNVAPLTAGEPLTISGHLKEDDMTESLEPGQPNKRKWNVFLSNAKPDGGVAVIGTATTLSFSRARDRAVAPGTRRFAEPPSSSLRALPSSSSPAPSTSHNISSSLHPQIRRQVAQNRATPLAQPSFKSQRSHTPTHKMASTGIPITYHAVDYSFIKRYASATNSNQVITSLSSPTATTIIPSSQNPTEPRLRITNHIVSPKIRRGKGLDPRAHEPARNFKVGEQTPFEKRGVKRVEVLEIRRQRSAVREQRKR